MAQAPAAAWISLTCLAGTLLLGACSSESPPPEYVARVGENVLLQQDVQRALVNLPALQDSADARQQIVEQWVTKELLYQEAERRGLRNDEDVQRLLAESERSVLVNALLSVMYGESDIDPTPGEMQSYFESNRDHLRLRESFAHVLYLETATRNEAEEARLAIQSAETAARDSIWADAVNRLAVDPTFASEISTDYYPESRLFAGEPALRDALITLDSGETAAVIGADSAFHVLHLVERLPPNTIPEQEWIEEELTRRLVIQNRKQLYARQVQRLRNEALAREDLEVK